MDICTYVRKEGLYLNELKTKVVGTQQLLHEETELDRMFESAKQELDDLVFIGGEYSFDPFDVREVEGNREYDALVRLYSERGSSIKVTEKIDKFCLPRFALSQDNRAVEDALNGIQELPHLSNVYARYLMSIAKNDANTLIKIESLILEDKLMYDWQKMWVLGLLYSAESVSQSLVDFIKGKFEDNNTNEVVRALFILILSKNGNGATRRLVRNRYANEPSAYVKEAILYSTKFFPSSDDRSACVKAWGGHSTINELIVEAIKKEANEGRS